MNGIQATLLSELDDSQNRPASYADLMMANSSWGDVWESFGCRAADSAVKGVLAQSYYGHSPTLLVQWHLHAAADIVPTHVAVPRLTARSLLADCVARQGQLVRFDPDWLVIAYKAGHELDLSEIEIIISGLTALLSAERFVEVDISLAGADPRRMTADAIVAIAHITYPAKEHLTAWQKFVERSRAALLNRGDLEDHLEGLV